MNEHVEPDACLCTEQQLNTKTTSLPFPWSFYQFSIMCFNSQVIPVETKCVPSVENQSKCSCIRAGQFGINVNGKILGIVVKDKISSTYISNAFRKQGVSL